MSNNFIRYKDIRINMDMVKNYGLVYKNQKTTNNVIHIHFIANGDSKVLNFETEEERDEFLLKMDRVCCALDCDKNIRNEKTMDKDVVDCIGNSDYYNGLKCSVCGEKQYDTPSGVCCINGHGGAEGVERYGCE